MSYGLAATTWAKGGIDRSILGALMGKSSLRREMIPERRQRLSVRVFTAKESTRRGLYLIGCLPDSEKSWVFSFLNL
jgi:hypothetical protein